MKAILSSLRIMAALTIVCGLIYPLVVTVFGQALFYKQANGSLLIRDGQVMGSELIAQSFSKPEYFWPRASAIGYNPLPSGGTNLGPTSLQLKKTVDERKAGLLEKNGPGDSAELAFASASGLDPHISPAAAEFQLKRVAQARGLPVERVRELIHEHIQARQLGILGEPTVNVLALNLSLDRLTGGQ